MGIKLCFPVAGIRSGGESELPSASARSLEGVQDQQISVFSECVFSAESVFYGHLVEEAEIDFVRGIKGF